MPKTKNRAADTKSSAAPEGAARAQGRLLAVHNEPVGPADLASPPVVTLHDTALECYQQVGRDDARSPGVDEHAGPGRPEQPSAAAVRNASRMPVDRLGERWEQTKASYETGQLGRIAPRPIHRVRAIAARTWGYWVILGLVLTAGVTAELVYGYRAAALLTLADPRTALLGAIAFSFAINGLAWYAAHLLFAHNHTIVRAGGAKLALVAAALIAVLVAILGLVVGGYDPIQMTTVQGGQTATAANTGPHARWTLTIAYALILTIVSAAIAAGHLLILDKTSELETRLQLEAARTAENASLTPGQQTALIRNLAEATIAAVPTAHRVGRQCVAAYNAAFRQHAPVVIGELFNDVDYDNSDPDWLPALHDFQHNLHIRNPASHTNISRIA